MLHARSIDEFSLEDIIRAKKEAANNHPNIDFDLRFEMLFDDYINPEYQFCYKETEKEINRQFEKMLELRYSQETIAVYSTLYLQLRDVMQHKREAGNYGRE